jgi:hypothetical protein
MNNFGRGNPKSYLVYDAGSLSAADKQAFLNNAALEGFNLVTVQGDDLILVRARLPLEERPYSGDGSEFAP